jgi:hypothetical protein
MDTFTVICEFGYCDTPAFKNWAGTPLCYVHWTEIIKEKSE